MAKFIKSIFTPEKKKQEDELDERDADPQPLDTRRKLSMSRSGRLKQAYRKRQQLSVEVYGGEDLDIQPTEKPKSMEYHVNTPASRPVTPNVNPNPKTMEPKTLTESEKVSITSKSDDLICKSPEEEIDKAFNFDVIDKS